MAKQVQENTSLNGKKTVIVGSSSRRSGYAALAYDRLVDHGHEIVLLGIRAGTYEEHEILDIHNRPVIPSVHTITLYINPARQEQWYDYFINLKPTRIIFNPGTENTKLKRMAEENGIETVYGCTLVMLSIGNY